MFSYPDLALQAGAQPQVPPELRPRPGDLVTLADPDGSFYDPQTRFMVSRGQSARLTAPVGQLTAEKIAGGGIVHAEPPHERPAA